MNGSFTVKFIVGVCLYGNSLKFVDDGNGYAVVLPVLTHVATSSCNMYHLDKEACYL